MRTQSGTGESTGPRERLSRGDTNKDLWPRHLVTCTDTQGEKDITEDLGTWLLGD